MNEPHPIEVVRWKCSNRPCNKGFSKRKTARDHAEDCAYDPENRSCMTCAHFEPGTYPVGYAAWGEAEAYCHVGVALEWPIPRNCDQWTSKPL